MRIGVSGHQNIPIDALAFVERGIVTILHRYGSDLIGISSLAAGADQLFASAVLRLGGRLHAVLPSRGYEESFARPADLETYLALVDQAEHVEVLDYPLPSEQAYLAAGKRIATTSDLLVAIWDGQPSRGLGGTADIVTHAREIGRSIEVIWPIGVVR